LKKEGYRYIACVSDEELAKMDELLTKAMRASEPRDDSETVAIEQFLIDYDFFDNALEAIEDNLAEQLFHDFFKSKFYKDYRQAISLNQGIKNLSV
jgi:hypothetical protein